MDIYAYNYDRDPTNNFAAACYDKYSAEELWDALHAPVNEADIKRWSLSGPVEYYDAIRAALVAKLYGQF